MILKSPKMNSICENRKFEGTPAPDFDPDASKLFFVEAASRRRAVGYCVQDVGTSLILFLQVH